MGISYKRLWKLLIDKEMNKTAMRKACGLSSASVAKLTKGQNVNTDVLVRICNTLDCDLSDIAEVIHEKPGSEVDEY